MSCSRLTESIANHFESRLSPAAREKHQQHLLQCSECRLETAALASVPDVLSQWQKQSVPEWDRIAAARPHGYRKSLPRRHSLWPAMIRWAPLAASLVLAVAVLTQTRLEVSESGWQISFGGVADNRQTEMQAWVESALRTHAETTADNVYQWMTWMEQQRELDVQRMEAGFEQLLNRDYQTVDSVRQLASYVMYQESP